MNQDRHTDGALDQDGADTQETKRATVMANWCVEVSCNVEYLRWYRAVQAEGYAKVKGLKESVESRPKRSFVECLAARNEGAI